MNSKESVSITGSRGGRLRAILLALAIGTAGGAIFQLLGLPLPWMLGAMTGTTIAAASGLPIAMPTRLRNLMVVVLGVMLGSAFTPDLLERLPQWTGSLAALFLYVGVATVLCQAYYQRFGGYDRTTAYFAAAPGGITEMILAGSAMGGDERAISLSHAARILLIVLILPLGFQLFGGYEPANRPPIGDAALTIPLYDVAILALCGVVGFFVAARVRLPAGALVGPMVLSAAVHLGGLTDSQLPGELVATAQLVVGASIGARFAGIRVGTILRALALAFGATVLLLAITAAFGAALHALTGLPAQAVLLAFAPGGVAEMSLIALALGIDAAYVATHHVVRIFIIVVTAPLAFRLLRWRRNKGA